MRIPKAEQQSAHREKLRALTTAEEPLAREMAHRTKREADAQSWTELAEVRKQLPPGNALVDIACLPVYDFAAKEGAPKWKLQPYVACPS